LQIVAPCGERRQSGVLLVPQLLKDVSKCLLSTKVLIYLHTWPLGTASGWEDTGAYDWGFSLCLWSAELDVGVIWRICSVDGDMVEFGLGS
jgi:hypothetical protein